MALFLREQGYRAYALRGGLLGWYEAGYPLEPKAGERARTVADICPECGQPAARHGAPHRR